MTQAEYHLKLAERVTRLMDSQFRILGFRFGLDPLLGLIPWAGDLITGCIALYLLWIGRKMNLPQEALYAMAKNLIVDLILGSLPFVGDIADFFYQANTKNLEILRKYSSAEFVLEGEVVA